MPAELQLPAGTGMQRHGHVLTLSGYWDEELLDELQHGLLDLRQALPRAPGRKLVTLHLINFGISVGAVNGALSLVRRAFVDVQTDVSVVAEGTLSEAGLLFLSRSQCGLRKAFCDAMVSLRIGRKLGISPAGGSVVSPSVMLSVPMVWRAQIDSGTVLAPQVTELLALGQIDKVLARS